jgi:hypothetical protein
MYFKLGTPPSIEIAAESESQLKPTEGASASVHLSGLTLSASELIHWLPAARIHPHREVDPLSTNDLAAAAASGKLDRL